MNKLLLLVGVALLVQASFAKFPNLKKRAKVHLPQSDIGEHLVLTPYLENNRIQDAKEAAEVHLEVFKDVTSYSGYFNVNKQNNASLFFWFFPSAGDYANDPVVLWLQGGPGGSSLYALFTENGPFEVNKDRGVEFREYSWHKNHSMIYIDQPVGTGFSYTDDFYVTDQTQVGAHLYDALTQFFTLFPELQNNAFFVSGESYAGKYIPAIGYTILQNNPTADLKINLKGLIIGNGLSDPINQVGYGDLLYEIGLTDKNGLSNYNKLESKLIEHVNNEQYSDATNVFNYIFNIFSEETKLYNVYNYLQEDTDDPVAWEYFLNQDDVRRAIHVGNQQYSSQSELVYDELMPDMMKSVAPWVSELLNNYKVLLYNGQLDIIVNYVLTVNYLQKLDFSAAEEYKNADRNVWLVDDNVAGFVKTAGNLTEVMVRNAGHMVPGDQPKAAYNLLYSFTRGLPLA